MARKSKANAVDDDKQLLMLAIGDDTSDTLGSVNVGGGGKQPRRARPLS
jgi:hypothetical protein